MNTRLLLVILVGLSLAGCTKKHEAEQMPVPPTSLNQAMPTQTELTLMPGSESAQPVDSQNKTVGAQSKAAGATAAMQPGAPAAASEVSTKTPTNEEIQKALQGAKLYTGKIDGDLGPRTKKAIKAFQEQNGLKADGKVGPKTWVKLQVYLNQTTEPAAESAASSVQE